MAVNGKQPALLLTERRKGSVMNYTESQVYLDNISMFGSVFGLETIRELLKRLGNPQDTLKFIHISGTNGKGSVLAYVSTVLTKAGYRTGRYISPHIVSYRERVQVDGEWIEKEAVAKYLTIIRDVSQQMEDDGFQMPTYFEVGTALAFLYFQEKNCDIVVLETGLGGALDATNAVNTTVMEIIASIGMDHMDVLGDTLEKIAGEKAGIIKPNTIVVSAKQEPEAETVIQKVCQEKNCRLYCVEPDQIRDVVYAFGDQCFSYKKWENVRISLSGTYQVKNASLALEAIAGLREIGFAISDEQVCEGMYHTVWQGRFTQIASEPTIIIDGAHNEDAARELRSSLQLYFEGKRIFYVLGVLKDKAYPKVIELTAPLAYHIITVKTPNNPRALSAEMLREAVAVVNPSVEAAESIADAIKKLKQQVTKEDVVVIFGSLSFLGEAEQAVLEEEDHE